MIDSNLYAVTGTEDYTIGPTNLVLAFGGPHSMYISWAEIRGRLEVKNACLAIQRNGYNSTPLVRIVGGLDHLGRIATFSNILNDARALVAQMLTDESFNRSALKPITDLVQAYRAAWVD
jgi:hypothetical protein